MRRIRRPEPKPRLSILVLVTAAAFAAVPALGQAIPAPDDRASSHELFSHTQLEQQERLGPKNITTQFPSPSTKPAGKITHPGGFDGHVGSVIAGIVALALGLTAAARLLRYRRRRDPTSSKGFAKA